MFDYHLFLGVPMEEALHRELDQLAPHLRSLFIQENGEDYLHQVEHAGHHYLGKDLGNVVATAELDAIKAHIISILHRLMPQYPVDKNSLQILAIPK